MTESPRKEAVYDKYFGKSSQLHERDNPTRWRTSRGFDRKGRTMRHPPVADEQKNWLTQEYYDLLTVTNVAATSSISEEDFDNKRRIMKACLSRMEDKLMPAEARIDALDIITSLLMNCRGDEILDQQNDRLFDCVVSTWNKPPTSQDEMFRGLQVLGLLALREGLNNDAFVRKLLHYTATIPDRYSTEEARQVKYRRDPPTGSRPTEPYDSENVRCQALATIAIAIFFCASSDDLIVQALDIAQDILCRPTHARNVTEDGPTGEDDSLTPITEPMRGAAADSWCLIAMRLEPTFVLSRVQRDVLHALRNLLFSQNLDTRVAGGEAIAWLYELAQETADWDEGPEIWLSPDGDIWADTLDQLEFLSREYDRRMSRRERREQHKMAAAFYKTLTEGTFPMEVLKMPDCQLSVETWGGVKILDILRHFMGGGFHEGLYHFQSVQDVLGMPDWMRKVIVGERTIEDEELDKGRVVDSKVWLEDGSILPNSRASRKFQSRRKERRHRSKFADELFPKEYDIPVMPTTENT